MFIAMDRANYNRKPHISAPFFSQSYEQYLESSPETNIPGGDRWLIFWDKVSNLTSKDLLRSSSPLRRELPLHDVESVFWVMVLFFIRASPSGTTHELSKEQLDRRSRAFYTLSQNSIGEDDGRLPLLDYSEDKWRDSPSSTSQLCTNACHHGFVFSNHLAAYQ